MFLGHCKIPGSISHCDSGKPGRAGLVTRLGILLDYLCTPWPDSSQRIRRALEGGASKAGPIARFLDGMHLETLASAQVKKMLGA